MDAVEFLQQYKLMCGQYNCSEECPIKQLLNKCTGTDVCDDAFIYLHPEEVVEAVLKWTKRKLMMNDEKCPYYKGVCGIDEQYLCYCSSTPNGCNIYKKFLEDQIRKASNQ